MPPATLDAGEDGNARWPDLGGDADPSKPSDLATSADAPGLGDGQTAREVLRDAEEDARVAGSDSAGDMGSAGGDGSGDVGQDRDVFPRGDANDPPADASPATDGGDRGEGTGPTADALDGVTASSDEVATGGMDAEDAGDDTSSPVAVEAGELDRDAPMDSPDTGAIAFDSASGEVPGSTIDPYLVLWYPFDESSGFIAYDMAQFGGVARSATLVPAGGTATFSTARQVGTHALALSPGANASSGGGYVVIPALNTLAPGAVTIAVWVNLAAATSNQAWERIYDFGDSASAPAWLNLTARNQTSPYGPVFNMSNTGHATSDQQKLTGTTALTPNTWHHLAVVLRAGATFTGTMYLDGEVAATNNAMTVHFSDIGATANNWLGRSQFGDPYFDGSLDDFRVYSRAFSQPEVQALMALQ